ARPRPRRARRRYARPPRRVHPARRRAWLRVTHRHDDHVPGRRLLQRGRRARRGLGRRRDRRRLGHHRPGPVEPRSAEPEAGRPRPGPAPALLAAHMRLFVTGAAGFIGSNYARHVLATTDDSVTVFDALTYAGNLDNLRDLDDDPRYTF